MMDVEPQARRRATATAAAAEEELVWNSQMAWKMSRYYFWISAVGAALAIFTTAAPAPIPLFDLTLFSKAFQESNSSSNTKLPPAWLRWIHKPVPPTETEASPWTLLDPNVFQLTDLIEKVLKSTVRMLLIGNFMLAFTVLLHTAVAHWFLGERDFTNQNRSGFVFKLLLISIVMAQDAFDLLLLLSWYTVLSFLQSLAGLCASETGRGRVPSPGVRKLLGTVLVLDVTAAAVCVTLFHELGTGMVLLLTCDCALLAMDVLMHSVQHVQLVWDLQHTSRIGALEEEQLRLHALDTTLDPTLRQDLSRELDTKMELLEQKQLRKTSVLDSICFCLQLVSDLVTIAHFCHIWYLHGFRFTLVDGVLALLLHSAVSSAAKKISERRNMRRIARDMDGTFEDASELDLRKASASGDVCCICLGTMTFLDSHHQHHNGVVKKVACGHLYHTLCLQEVVERARSMESAKCPLCRGFVVHRHRDDDSDFAPAVREPEVNEDLAVGVGDHALFRFSTENLFPTWLPLPSFSFEVVRRPPNAPAETREARNEAEEANQPQASFLRRLLLIAGVVSMTPAEERAALTQLVDMFPQYDRQDLVRVLRARGSAEAVAESVLMGTFVGVARGEGR